MTTRGQKDTAREDKLRNLAASAGRARGGQAGASRERTEDEANLPSSGRRARHAESPRSGQRVDPAGSQRHAGSSRSRMRSKSSRARNDAPPAKRMTLVEFIRLNIGYIAAVVLVVVLVTVGIFAIKAFLPEEASDGSASGGNASDGSVSTPAYVSPYDWTKLDRSEGRYHYVVDGEVKSRLGVDVSENQQEIDWQAVAADGVEFAIIRVGYRGATEGGLFIDERFWENLEGAHGAGLDCGVYFFSQANTEEEAVEEADFVLERLGGVNLEYPVAFDSEVVNLKGEVSPTAELSRDEMTTIARAFCTRIAEAGYKPLLYGNYIDLARYHLGEMGDMPIWWAEYGTPVPTAQLTMDVWQYSNDGKVAGIPTAVDLNIDLRGVLNESAE